MDEQIKTAMTFGELYAAVEALLGSEATWSIEAAAWSRSHGDFNVKWRIYQASTVVNFIDGKTPELVLEGLRLALENKCTCQFPADVGVIEAIP